MGLIYFILPLLLQILLYLFIIDKGYIKLSILFVIIALYIVAVPAMIVDQPVNNIAGPEDVVTCGPPPMLVVFILRTFVSVVGTITALVIYFGFRWLSVKAE